MTSITIGNKLYLYQLLSREIGIGRQVMLSHVEEVLLADDIWPSDLGCDDVRQVLEHLNEFVRLTVFKKGRVYATIVAHAEWDTVLERAQKADEPKKPAAKGGARSWKRKKSNKDPRPAKPRPKNRPQPIEPVVEDGEKQDAKPTLTEEEPTAEHKQMPEDLLKLAPEPEPAVEAIAEQEVVPTPEAELAVEPIAEPTAEAATQSVAEVAVEPAPAVEADAEPTPEPPASQSDAEPVREPSISFTVTYNPYEDEDAISDDVNPPVEQPEVEQPVSVQPTAEQPPTAQPTDQSPISQVQYPQHFATEVHVRNSELSALYQMLPLDVDPLALLDEDWRVARSTQTFTQENGVVSFPLRYAKNSEGEPVCVGMRRGTANKAGKRWTIEFVDEVEAVGFEGLPTTADECVRELAQFASLGSWENLVEQLAAKHMGPHTPLSAQTLREYLTVTFHRVMCEDKFVAYDNGRGAFDTGLLNQSGESILMCFTQQEGDIAWKFLNFLSANEANLPQPAPQPASYVTSLANVTIASESNVTLSKSLVRAYGPELQDAVDTALRRAKRDYRLATPAYDPVANEVRLLIPVTLEEDTLALVLCPAGDRFEASALVPLSRAAQLAHIVSFELPSWLRQ